ncbi:MULTISPECIES: hypothetical protein [Streptomyces]|uniref:Lactococcin 972 family bacteriocin n=1 Tax=Streptomyces lichenis TaxID=2306967 RepID=A0ABT0I736_9ACTN|nr:hypothetical protein [Streptomyces lichenis]MCK8677129.1 hypothetical protein [Streptomyces lichenis]
MIEQGVMHMFLTKKRIATVGLVAALALPATAAVAGEISGSRLPFSIQTSGSAEDSNRWNGPGSGHAKPCGDVPASQPNSFSAYIYEDKSFLPDPQVASTSRAYSQAYGCGSYKGTNTGGKYYTKATWSGIPGSRANGFVAAEN